MSISTAIETVSIPQTPRKRGRPKGSKNKPKVAPVVVPEAMTPYIPESIRKVAPLQPAVPEVPRPALNTDGFPNLPEGKIVGRPMGKKNSGPRKPRAPREATLPSSVETPVPDEALPLVE